MQRPDIEALQCKFDTGKEPFEFDTSLLSSQYRIYENDVTIDFQYQLCNKDYVKFWCELYRGDEYKELATVAFHICDM